MTDLLQLLDAPQLGEFAWHQVTADPSIDHMSRTHLRSMEQLVRSAGAHKLDRPARVLELGSYRHYAGHLLADEHSAEVWLSDISAQALRDGKRLAVAKGIKRFGQLCTADFHDLPFADGWFDVVFIASAVHHTRTPERVLREMLRVLRPGGVLQLQNEPVGREFCAYAFNSNRAESFTNLEQAVDQAGLMRTVSSPFFGTRPEEMFQMVENDCIPLDLYLHELSQGAHIDELELRTDNTIGDLEKRMLGWVEKDPSTATARVAQHLIDLCRNLPTDDPAANAMGFRGLYANECWTLAGRLPDAADDLPDYIFLEASAPAPARVRIAAGGPPTFLEFTGSGLEQKCAPIAPQPRDSELHLVLQQESGGLALKGVLLFDHTQDGGVYTLDGDPGPLLEPLRDLNRTFVQSSSRLCTEN